MDQLIVIALYPAQDEITKAICEAIAASECEQVDIDLGTKGKNEQAITIKLSGSWSQLTRFKTRLFIIQQHYSIQAIIKDIEPVSYPLNTLPYQAYLTTFGNPKVIDHIVQFFLSLPVTLYDFSVNTYQAPVTQATMFDIHFTFVTPHEKPISDYRENILQFCDENNFEIVLESKRA